MDLVASYEPALDAAKKQLSAQITQGEVLGFSSTSHNRQAEGEGVFTVRRRQ